jgi:hypothetical protein
MDVRLVWFAAIVNAVTAEVGRSKPATADEDGTAALLLDPRLMWTKCMRVESFFTGIAASFLPGHVSILNQVPVGVCCH